MTDRELLEAAAKAADLIGRDGVFPVGTPDGQWRPWNPLEDDGDALRLAVKAELVVVTPWTSGGYKRCRADHTPTGRHGPWVENIADPLAATRRAIVRAAAAISESK
jgi:hypothetical protein